MTGTYKNIFCGSAYRLFYKEERVLDKDGKLTKRTKETLYCQKISSENTDKVGEPFKPRKEDWEKYIRLGTMIKINDE